MWSESGDQWHQVRMQAVIGVLPESVNTAYSPAQHGQSTLSASWLMTQNWREECIWGELNKLQKWADGNMLKLNHGNCKALHLGKNKSRDQYIQGVGKLSGKQLGREVAGSLSGHQVEYEPAVCPCGHNGTLSCKALPARVVILPLYSALRVATHEADGTAPISGLHRATDFNILESIQQKVTKMMDFNEELKKTCCKNTVKQGAVTA